MSQYVIRSESEQGYWNNQLGWVVDVASATKFDHMIHVTLLPNIGVPDCRCLPLTNELEDFKDYDEPERKAFWQCEECGHQDHDRPLPPDRQLFYANQAVRIERLGQGGYKCPSCQSMALMPRAF